MRIGVIIKVFRGHPREILEKALNYADCCPIADERRNLGEELTRRWPWTFEKGGVDGESFSDFVFHHPACQQDWFASSK
jgi:hypothetical protein